jgi:hypothetical protein
MPGWLSLSTRVGISRGIRAALFFKALWDRFEFVYTPKHGSWLNMAEIELNVLIGQCLNRRIAEIDVMHSAR